jgi:flagellar basal-body rod protein FlgC
MGFGSLFSSTDISGSALGAERLRMEVVANNIANANSTRSAEGGTFRRQQVIFEAAMEQALGGGLPGSVSSGTGLGGVRVVGIEADQSPLHKVHNPGHPDADENGYVEMPNVTMPREMIDLITASRAYEANLKSLQTFRQMAEQALSLIRASG